MENAAKRARRAEEAEERRDREAPLLPLLKLAGKTDIGPRGATLQQFKDLIKFLREELDMKNLLDLRRRLVSPHSTRADIVEFFLEHGAEFSAAVTSRRSTRRRR